jgi:hypothetical protein
LKPSLGNEKGGIYVSFPTNNGQTQTLIVPEKHFWQENDKA